MPRKTTNPTSDSPAARSAASTQIDAMIAALDDWRGERLAEIRALIHAADPDVIEDWKWRGAPVWSHDGMIANAGAFKGKVKITFHHGAHLADPKRLFNAGLGGKQWRAIDLHEGDRLDRAAFKALVRAALAYNRTHDVPTSKGSRT